MSACNRADLPVSTCEQEADRVSEAVHYHCVRLDGLETLVDRHETKAAGFRLHQLHIFFSSQEAPISCT